MTEDSPDESFDTFEQYRKRILPTLSRTELIKQVDSHSRAHTTSQEEGRADLMQREVSRKALQRVRPDLVKGTFKSLKDRKPLKPEYSATYRAIEGKEPEHTTNGDDVNKTNGVGK